MRILSSVLMAITLLPAIVAAKDVTWVATEADEILDEFLEDKWREDVERSPELKNSLGIDEDQGKWTPVSDARKREDAELAGARLTELEGTADIGRLSDAGKLNYELYRYELETALLHWEYQQNSYAFTRTSFDPYAARPQYLVSRHRVENIGGAENYIARMVGLVDTLAELKAATENRAKEGIVLAAFNFDDIARTSRQIASGQPCDAGDHDNRLWADFKAKLAALDLSEVENDRLRDEAAHTLRTIVCPAYLQFADTFDHWGQDVSRNDGIWATPNGDRYYRMAIRLFTTRDLEPAEIHETGLAEVRRIENEIGRIMDEEGFKGSVNEYFAHLSKKPDMLLPQTNEGRDAYIAAATAFIDDMQSRLPEYFSVLPKAQVVAAAVEKEREQHQGGAFYIAPPLDGTAPGTFYVNLSRMSQQPLWRLETLAYHEAIPGHHLQIALAREGEGYPELRKNFSNSGYQEGWALYAEALAKEMGAYPPGDPGDVGRLHAELRRAVRLVVDTGIHYKRWTMDQSSQYIVDHLQSAPDSAMREMERYTNWPGQALSYKLGQLEIQALREKARKALGDSFDLREFHTAVLNEGVLPFHLLERQVMKWVAAQREGT